MINIISAVWQRPERLTYTLTQLERQTNRNFALCIVNNNYALQDFIENTIDELEITYWIEVIHNVQNRGPFARWEVMYQYRNDAEWFMTLDDDAIFDETLIEQWMQQKQENTMMGWNGFLFAGDYWTRINREPGEDCHYLWGSNLCLDARLIDERILGLPQRYYQCDDLWGCFHVNHVRGGALRKADIQNFSINVDGQDTYLSQQKIKIEALNWLREAHGWRV